MNENNTFTQEELDGLGLEALREIAIDLGLDPSGETSEIIGRLIGQERPSGYGEGVNAPSSTPPPVKRARGRPKGSKKQDSPPADVSPATHPDLDGKVRVNISVPFNQDLSEVYLSVNGKAMIVLRGQPQDIPWAYYLALHSAVTDHYRTGKDAQGHAEVVGPFPFHTYPHTVIAFGRRPKEYQDIPLEDLLNNNKLPGEINKSCKQLAEYARSLGA